MASLLGLFNRLIPFATPGTPILQDLLHLASLCALLYFAPQIQIWLQQNGSTTIDHGGFEGIARPASGVDAGQAHHAPDHVLEPRQPEQGQQHPNERVAEIPEAPGVPEAGPAHPPLEAGPEAARQSNVGTKKAKSLARKDQRRAYHEHMRAQGDVQRAKDAEGAEEREAALAREKERRRLAESQLEAQKAAEREARRIKDEKVREENARRIDFVVQTVREELDANRMCDLFRIAQAAGEDVEEEWAEQVLKASGMMGMHGDTMTMITQTGWAARVSAQDMLSVYQAITMENAGDEMGRISDESLAESLTATLKARSAVFSV